MPFSEQVAKLERTNAKLVAEVTRARDAAMGLMNVWPTRSQGRSNTEVGKYFSIPGEGDTFITLYQRTSSGDTLVSRYPTQEAVTESISRLLSDSSVPDGDFFGVSDIPGVTFFDNSSSSLSNIPEGSAWGTVLDIRRLANRHFRLYFKIGGGNGGNPEVYITNRNGGSDSSVRQSGWHVPRKLYHDGDFQVQDGSRDSTSGRLLIVGAFGLGGTSSPSILPNPGEGAIPAGIYRDAGSDSFNPPARSSILVMQGYSNSQVLLAIERVSGAIHTTTVDSNGVIRNRWLTNYNQRNILDPVGFNDQDGLPTGGIIESGGARNTGWYVKYADGSMEVGVSRTAFVYQSSNVLRFRFDFPVEIPQIIGCYATLLDPYNTNETQYTNTFLATNLGSITERFRARTYARFQIGAPSAGGWSSGDTLYGNVLIKGRWRDVLPDEDVDGGSE